MIVTGEGCRALSNWLKIRIPLLRKFARLRTTISGPSDFGQTYGDIRRLGHVSRSQAWPKLHLSPFQYLAPIPSSVFSAMTSQGSCHNSFAQSQSSSISTTSSLFSSHPLSNPVPSTSRSLISLPAMESVKKCRRCIAKAAKDWKEKVCSLRRKSDPGTRADYPSDFTDSSERHVSFNDELYQHTRGRRRTRSSSLNSKQVNGRISSRSSSSPGSISTKCEYSPPPSHRFPIPDPNIALPTPLTTLFRRCTTSCHLTPSNNASRSCMIKASCIPQLEWRRADCRDWIAACFREVYGLSAPCALKKASRQMEAGDRIYYTQLWIWEERWPCCGKEMYYRLQECRNKGMVRGVKPERGHREFIPVEYRCGFVEEKE